MKKKYLLLCMVLLVVCASIIPVNAEGGGNITLWFNDRGIDAQPERLAQYGYSAVQTEPTTDFTSMHIRVVKVEDGVESTCWESNVTALENISIALDPGTYKVYTQLEGDDTVLEYNNGSEGYVISSQSHVVIPMAYPPWEGYILDVPWRIEKSKTNIPILAVANNPPTYPDINNIYVYDHNNGDSLVTSTNWDSPQPIDSSNTPFFYLFNIDKNLLVHVNGEVSIRIKFDLHWCPANWEGPKNVRISLDDIPEVTDWYSGDTHLHTNYTSNVVEYGAPIYATRAADNAMGLDWMIITDHSFDLDPDKWTISTADCNAHSDNLFKVIPGEEVSCYVPETAPHRYYHLLVYDADFIPGGEWEAIGSNTTSGYTAEEAISIANSQGGFTYPAHPMYSDGIRIPWQDEDYNLPFTGLQIWNYGSDKPTHLPDGLAKWSELLLDGRHVYVEGGTDAHGDFNTLAGRVKTYVYASGYSQSSLPPRSEILNALRNGHSVMTDGPLVIFDINGEMIGNNVSLTNGTNATLRIQWNSTQEFGYINNIIVKKGVINGSEETNFTTIQPSSIGKNSLCDEHELILSPNESCYYRVEAYSNTTNGERYRCYTNPIWVDVLANDTAPPVVTITAPVNGSIVSTPNVTVTGFATDDVGIVTMCYGHVCKGKGGGGGCASLANSSINVSINWTVYHLCKGWNIISVAAIDAAGNAGNASVTVIYKEENITTFDTGPGTYPSIFGMHNGTITSNQTITVSKLYTYPCIGTGGHTEYAKMWNSTLEVIANWDGYKGDWHNISFNNSFILEKGKTYNYTIRTGSYPQIHHTDALPTANGWINCTKFTDTNGRVYYDRIPAIKFFW